MNDLSSDQLASLMDKNMGLVVTLVNSFKPKNENEADEFMQLGRIGLWKAINKHDPEKAKLSTLIWHYVKWEILRHLDKRKKDKTHLPIKDSICGELKNAADIWEFIPDTLNKKEKHVVQLRLEGHTFLDIGEKIGCSRGWANNIFKSAMEKINEANES